jgi:hypothetical protein
VEALECAKENNHLDVQIFLLLCEFHSLLVTKNIVESFSVENELRNLILQRATSKKFHYIFFILSILFHYHIGKTLVAIEMFKELETFENSTNLLTLVLENGLEIVVKVGFDDNWMNGMKYLLKGIVYKYLLDVKVSHSSLSSGLECRTNDLFLTNNLKLHFTDCLLLMSNTKEAHSVLNSLDYSSDVVSYLTALTFHYEGNLLEAQKIYQKLEEVRRKFF